jgi:hypothetical protein
MQHGFVGCEVEAKKRVVAIPDTVITIASESSGSAAGDRCSSTKPGVSGGRLEPQPTAPSDDDEQSSRGARRDRDSQLR